jgi:hypothetical protein
VGRVLEGASTRPGNRAYLGLSYTWGRVLFRQSAPFSPLTGAYAHTPGIPRDIFVRDAPTHRAGSRAGRQGRSDPRPGGPRRASRQQARPDVGLLRAARGASATPGVPRDGSYSTPGEAADRTGPVPGGARRGARVSRSPQFAGAGAGSCFPRRGRLALLVRVLAGCFVTLSRPRRLSECRGFPRGARRGSWIPG